MSYKNPRAAALVSVSALLLFSLWLCYPLIFKGVPYITDEDEGHHFNRVVNMAKSGDYNPHYFLKPSLHFYLRQPAVWASYLYLKHKGEIDSIQKIRTGDPFGLSGYAFALSHPAVFEANRAFTVLFYLGALLCTFFIARLFVPDIFALGAVWLSGISPALLSYSAVIGVDMVMVFMVLLGILLSLLAFRNFSIFNITVAGFVCGLAASTKYNAAPLCALPALSVLLSGKGSLKGYMASIISPVAGFFAGSPYILVSFPLFLEHVGYEIWHYGVSGHAGHECTRGIGQALCYARWAFNSALSPLPLALGILSIPLIFRRDKRLACIFLFFPVAFFLLMTAQKAHFPRNMLSLVPIAFILASFFVYETSQNMAKIGKTIYIFLFLVLSSYPLLRSSLSLRHDAKNFPEDTRIAAFRWLKSSLRPLEDAAISGNLNFIPQVYGMKGVTRIDERKADVARLYLEGFSLLVVGPDFTVPDNGNYFLHLVRYFKGLPYSGRVVVNPEIRIFRLKADKTFIPPKGILPAPQCFPSESYCWITSRLAFIPLREKELGQSLPLTLSLMTPWSGQKVIFSLAEWKSSYSFRSDDLGKWVEVSLSPPKAKLKLSGGIKVELLHVHSPFTQKISSDKRRLGIAIKR
ncbi:MAG: hypothetical protein D6808_01460 [Candidatus Dadabacteria bacterium]|nr:MAG: hypothetical protein D6808_01460 [Candidatus Dadabacteria bacterium]